MITTSESPQVFHLSNTQQFFKLQPQAMNSLFPDSHVRNLYAVMCKQFGRFSRNLLIHIFFFAVFLRTETEHEGTCFFHKFEFCDFCQATLQLFDVLKAFVSLLTDQINLTILRSDLIGPNLRYLSESKAPC